MYNIANIADVYFNVDMIIHVFVFELRLVSFAPDASAGPKSAARLYLTRRKGRCS